MRTLYKYLITALLSSIAFSDTQMWWAEGYPYGSHVENERQPLRVLQTNDFALVLNTETLEIKHFGVRKSKVPYVNSTQDFARDWKKLPAAKLELSYILGGEKFIAVGADRPRHPKTIHFGPRLIESGRFWQRGDIWMVNFRGESGKIETKNFHFEIGAWTDKIILTARLAEEKGGGEISLQLTSQDQKWIGKGRIEGGKGKARVILTISGNEIKQKAEGAMVQVSAKEPGKEEMASYSEEFQAFVIDLGAVSDPRLPKDATKNDFLLKCPVVIKNTGESSKDATLVFEYDGVKSFQQEYGVPITGISAILCDELGRPTGIPIQLSKNWHKKADFGKIPNDSTWFRAFTKVPLNAGEEKRYEMRIVHGHWGGLPAASHAQLSLIGWGTNQLWEESALGAWGETICYEPTRAHRDSFITDVRPLMITGKNGKKWSWANNMGGADFLCFERPDGSRISSSLVRGTYLSTGPCLTDTRYTGVMGNNEATFEVRTALGRTDDFSRATYHLRLQVHKDIEISRSALFQLGADHYNDPLDRKIAWGNIEGVTNESYTEKLASNSESVELIGDSPWVSMHNTQRLEKHGVKGGIATRGVIIRQWRANIAGKPVNPHIIARKSPQGHIQAEIVLPDGVTTLKKGDEILAIIELLLPPKSMRDYYGKNQEFLSKANGQLNRWEIIADNAKRHQHVVTAEKGRLLQVLPDIRLEALENHASFKVRGGHYKYTAVTITGLTSPTVGQIYHNGELLKQEIHGHDYYQVSYDPVSKSWSKTFNIKFAKAGKHMVEFK